MDFIKISKEFSKIRKEANEYTKGTNCTLCGKECSSFCNSHTIPRFVIKNISENGKVYIPSMSFEKLDLDARLKLFQANPGVEKTLTFECICRECDNGVFSCVENETVLEKAFDGRILNLYALKILLHTYYSKIKSTNFLNIGAEKKNRPDIASMLSTPWIFDAIETTREIRDYKSAMENGAFIKHKIILDIILDKKVNFCTTTEITLPFSYLGKKINDLAGEESYRTRFGGIFILILPLKSGKTRVVMYYRRKYSVYDTVRDEFENMDLETKLQAISNILIIYTEEFVYNDSVLPNIKKAEDIMTYDIVNDSEADNYLEMVNFLNEEKINMFDM